MKEHTNYWGEVTKPLNPRIRQGLELIYRAIQEFLNYWGANRPFTADDVNKYLGIHIEYNTFSTDPYSYVEPRIDLEQFLVQVQLFKANTNLPSYLLQLGR